VFGLGDLTSAGFGVYYNYGSPDYTISFDIYGVETVSSTVALNLDAWNHIAFVRLYNEIFKIYVNGVTVFSTFSSNITQGDFTSNRIVIGKRFVIANENNNFNGLISDIRLTKKEVYTGPFVVPTVSLYVPQAGNTNGISPISLLECPFLMEPNEITVLSDKIGNASFTNYGLTYDAVDTPFL
jgi:hypothetical protein